MVRNPGLHGNVKVIYKNAGGYTPLNWESPASPLKIGFAAHAKVQAISNATRIEIFHQLKILWKVLLALLMAHEILRSSNIMVEEIENSQFFFDVALFVPNAF